MKTKVLLKIFLIIFSTFMPINKKEETLKEINYNNEITNLTKISNLDTVVLVGLSLLEIENVHVTLLEVTKNQRYSLMYGEVINGFVIKKDYCTFYLYISTELTNDKIILYTSHELIHIEQVIKNKLIIEDSYEYVYWDNKRIGIYDFTYRKRPWEIDAYSRQNQLFKDIKKHLSS
jgi:hypothetical protein